MVIFSLIPKWAQTLFWNRIVTEPVLIWKQRHVDPRVHMGIPIWKRGALSFDSPYGNEDTPFLYGDVSVPVSICGSPYGNGEPFRLIPHMETGIPHFHMGMCHSPSWRPTFLVMRWRLVHDPMAGQKYSPRFHTGSSLMEMGRQTKKFPFGDSPFQNRVFSHMGINICPHAL
jgi:hypothetical protein